MTASLRYSRDQLFRLWRKLRNSLLSIVQFSSDPESKKDILSKRLYRWNLNGSWLVDPWLLNNFVYIVKGLGTLTAFTHNSINFKLKYQLFLLQNALKGFNFSKKLVCDHRALVWWDSNQISDSMCYLFGNQWSRRFPKWLISRLWVIIILTQVSYRTKIALATKGGRQMH